MGVSARVRSAVILAMLCASTAQADRAAPDRASVDAARVDWASGLVVAGGTGIADRHAPSPAVALGTSRRGAEEAARKKLADAVGTVPLATGGTLATALTDAAVRARIDAAVEAAITVAAEPETDGSWHVTLAVPLEALRLAVAGPRALAATGDAGPAVIVVEGAAAKPALGWTIGGVAAPVIWVKDVPAWAREAPRIKARSSARGAIDAAGAAGTPATLYVVVARG